MKIRRDAGSCNGCGACGRNCPSQLSVDASWSIGSPECTGCLTCIESCPEPGTLKMVFSWRRFPVGSRAFACLVIGFMLLGIGSGMASGHWQTILSYQDIQDL
ncbi:MAG: 4Fe-4S dicluster domain-containing protein [Desulfuromonadales bacterium]